MGTSGKSLSKGIDMRLHSINLQEKAISYLMQYMGEGSSQARIKLVAKLNSVKEQ